MGKRVRRSPIGDDVSSTWCGGTALLNDTLPPISIVGVKVREVVMPPWFCRLFTHLFPVFGSTLELLQFDG